MSEQFKIEKGIKAPDRISQKVSSYPFRQMKVGESFFIRAIGTADKFEKRQRVASAASYFGIRNPPFKFSLRTIPEGIRVWRIK